MIAVTPFEDEPSLVADNPSAYQIETVANRIAAVSPRQSGEKRQFPGVLPVATKHRHCSTRRLGSLTIAHAAGRVVRFPLVAEFLPEEPRQR